MMCIEAFLEDYRRRESFFLFRDGPNVSGAIIAAICKAAADPDAKGLLALLTSPEGQAVSRNWRWPEVIAVAHGHTKCLSVLKQCGYTLDDSTWTCAAVRGQLHCLQFAVNHNYTLEDWVFEAAMESGSFACVDYLVQLGFPHTPYRHYNYPLTADQVTCMEVMLGKGGALDPGNLLMAAANGDVKCVRALHKRGVPLWQHMCHDTNTGKHYISIPGSRGFNAFILLTNSDRIYKAMRYGSLHGAPVSHALKNLFRRKRQCTHAVLCCFNRAARQSQRPGAAGGLTSMAAVPREIIEKIVILADLEIEENVMRPIRRSAPACAG